MSEIKLLELFPEDHKYFTFLKKVFRHNLRKKWFRRVSSPILTESSLYTKSWQEKYNKYFLANNKDLNLKFDSSLSILNSYIMNNKKEELQPVYYYYIENLFRETNKWIKEITTIGWEIIWEHDPILDIELIHLNCTVLDQIWLAWKYEVRVNPIWIKKEQEKFIEALKDFYSNKKHNLTEESIKDLEINPLKLLTPKSEDEEILLSEIPKMEKYLKKHWKAFFDKFKEFLELLNIDYKIKNTFFWNREYFSYIAWEIVEKETGKEIASGWRYDNLAQMISDSKEIPWSGFYTEIPVIIEMLKNNNIKLKNKDELDLYFVQLWDEAKKEVLPIALKAREAWINTLTSLWTPSMKEQMLKAQRSLATFVVIVWIMEARNWIWQVRDTINGKQEEVKKENIIDYIIEKIWTDKLDFYSPIKDLVVN